MTVAPDDESDVHDPDDLPLWSAPFGLKLLERVRVRPDATVLDVGFGTGFPLVELAMRLGPMARVHGLDPSAAAHRAAAQKLARHRLANVTLHVGVAEAMPFDARTFDCVVSNNGYNNVADRVRAFGETARVCRPGAQLAFTMNLDGSFRELHAELERVLDEEGLAASRAALRAFIASRRPPLDDVLRAVGDAGFAIDDVAHDEFAFRFASAGALAGHTFFRDDQLPNLREVVPAELRTAVFEELARRLDARAAREGELRLGVPFVTVVAIRKEKA
ncbi:MAG TPA: class I SAM-dependent methyltransferase [Haliangiales bacterium]|nr:class I SAM-dependent methyltransferase [Haliangiales bacterium]